MLQVLIYTENTMTTVNSISSEKFFPSFCGILSINYFVVSRLVYDSHSGTFLDVDTEQMSLADSEEPPNNCPVCLLGEQRNSEELPQQLQTGVAWHAVNYHIHDFVMIKAVDGPCQVGHIIRIQFPESSRLEDKPFATVNLLGRIGNVKGRPRELMRDEVRKMYLKHCCCVLHRNHQSGIFSSPMMSWRLMLKILLDCVLSCIVTPRMISSHGCLNHHTTSTVVISSLHRLCHGGVRRYQFSQRIFWFVKPVLPRDLNIIAWMKLSNQG